MAYEAMFATDREGGQGLGSGRRLFMWERIRGGSGCDMGRNYAMFWLVVLHSVRVLAVGPCVIGTNGFLLVMAWPKFACVYIQNARQTCFAVRQGTRRTAKSFLPTS
jgi:hypothetical protein